MNVEAILIMATSVLAFTAAAVTIATILGVAIGQARMRFQKEDQS